MKTVSMEQVKQAGLLLKREHEERLRLEKEAGALNLEKRAMKIAFREVEMGLAEPFTTYDELLEKVASLLKEDLNVIEKALERGYVGSGNIGTLAEDHTAGRGRNELERWILNGQTD
jgi:hypothetical protein